MEVDKGSCNLKINSHHNAVFLVEGLLGVAKTKSQTSWYDYDLCNMFEIFALANGCHSCKFLAIKDLLAVFGGLKIG